ncbi:hypothetical protein J6590_032902 [Homalodisca vitripennis]|nr:hypothetical protein J6590_032902 [Homalodisca vitripennis]
MIPQNKRDIPVAFKPDEEQPVQSSVFDFTADKTLVSYVLKKTEALHCCQLCIMIRKLLRFSNKNAQDLPHRINHNQRGADVAFVRDIETRNTQLNPKNVYELSARPTALFTSCATTAETTKTYRLRDARSTNGHFHLGFSLVLCFDSPISYRGV